MPVALVQTDLAVQTPPRLRTSSAALFLSAAALVSGVSVLAQNRPRPRTISVDEVHSGMRGYGLTVFHGTRPERFEIEVVDVIHNARPGMDMVLIRTPHPVLDRASSVAGMSGSPIYLDDRLLGAYAYGWEFGTEPIAGVTPISNMLAEARRTRRTPPGLIPGTQIPMPIGGDTSPMQRTRRRSSWDVLSDRMRLAQSPIQSAHGRMMPVGVSLGVSGMSDGALRMLSDAFTPMGLEPVQSGGAGRRNASSAPPGEAIPTHYENGGSVSVSLVSGDISAAATGTVTLVDGNDVLAFGHPMMGLGEVALPAALSRVAWIMVSARRSHKMAEPIADLGALQQDRPFTIVLDEHAAAPTVPMHVRVLHNEGGAHNNEWNVRLAYHRALLSRLYGSVIGTALETSAGEATDVAWVVHSNVVTRDHGTLSFTDLGASGDGTGALSVGGLGSSEAVERLTENPYEQVRIERIDVDIDLHWARDFYYIRSSALSRAEVDPGETVQLTVSLGQYAGAPVLRTIPITVPREVAGRDVDIEVSAGGDTLGDQPEPERIEDLIRNLTSSYPDDSIVVSMRMPGQGVMLRGRVLYDLPGSALDTLRPAASTDTGEPFLNVRRTVVPVGRLVLGRDRLRIHVRDIRQ